MSVRARQARQRLKRALESEPAEGSLRAQYRMVNALHPAEIAALLESLPPERREILWEFIDPEIEGEVLVELAEPVRASLMRDMGARDVLAAIEGMPADDVADLVSELPEKLTEELLAAMSRSDRERLNNLLSWPEESAGGLMNTDTVSVRADVTVEVVLRYLRMRDELPEKTDLLFVVDHENRYLGAVPLVRLITEDPDRRIGEILATEAPSIDPNTPAQEVARIFRDLDLHSAAVVGPDGRLLGRITIDDVVDVIREEGDRAVLSMGGLADAEDAFAGVLSSVRRRLPWLATSALAALTAGFVVRQFEDTIRAMSLLAVAMPIVASMGGIAGTQTVTLVVRGLALGHIQRGNSRWLLFKEAGVGALSGITWAVTIALLGVFWLGRPDIALVAGLAMLVNLLAAGFIGAGIPMLLHRLRLDPALGSGVVLTTCTDIIGFATLLGLATLLLV